MCLRKILSPSSKATSSSVAVTEMVFDSSRRSSVTETGTKSGRREVASDQL